MKKNFLIFFLVFACAAGSFTACGKKDKQENENGNTESTESVKDAPVKTETKKDEAQEDNLIPEMRQVVTAIEAAAGLPAFCLDTGASLKLNGTILNDEFNMKSEIHVLQPEGGMQMTMVSSSNVDDAVSRAYYKDGWYYTDDKNGKNKEEKTPEEVLRMVSDVTALVTDAAEEITSVKTKEKNGSTVYSYRLPQYLAEDYLHKLTKSAAAKDTALENVDCEVESAKLKSTLDRDGMLTAQELKITGTLYKSLLKVPAEAKVRVEFTETDEKELKMELW